MFLCNLLIVSYKGTKNISFPQLFQSFSYTELTYFKHAPKLFTFSREQVWEIITGFLERNAEELGAQAFLAAIDGGDEVKSICFSIYDASVGA